LLFYSITVSLNFFIFKQFWWKTTRSP